MNSRGSSRAGWGREPRETILRSFASTRHPASISLRAGTTEFGSYWTCDMETIQNSNLSVVSEPSSDGMGLVGIAARLVLSALALASFAWWFGGLGLGLWIAYLITAHELGHLKAAKDLGYRTGGFALLPFLGGGASITDWEKIPHRHRIHILLGGPIVGFVSAIGPGIVWLFTRDPVHLALFEVAVTLNALNLLPIPPLDGGRIMLAGLPNHRSRPLVFMVVAAALAFLASTCGISGEYAAELF